MRIINSFGIAELNQEVLLKVRAMHPKRTEAVRLPSEDEIKEELRKNETGGDGDKINQTLPITSNSELQLNMDLDQKAECIEGGEESREDRLWRSLRLARTQVLDEDIVRIARLAKSSTRGGIQPWVRF